MTERMEPRPANYLEGTLDLLIPKALTLSELHGLWIARRIAFAIASASRAT
jgi:hypothetical protein